MGHRQSPFEQGAGSYGISRRYPRGALTQPYFAKLLEVKTLGGARREANPTGAEGGQAV